MTKLRFTDGQEFNTDGALRIEERSDGFYVVGKGRLIPAKDRKEAEEVLSSLILANPKRTDQ